MPAVPSGAFTGVKAGVVMAVLAGLMFTGLMVRALVRVDRGLAAEVFEQRVSRCCERVASRTEALMARLSQGERWVRPGAGTSPGQWTGWCRQQVMSAFPEVVEIAYVPWAGSPDQTNGVWSLRLQYYAVPRDFGEDPEDSTIHRLWTPGAGGDPGDAQATLERVLMDGRPRMTALVGAGMQSVIPEGPSLVQLYLPVLSAPDAESRPVPLTGFLVATLDFARFADLPDTISAALERRCEVRTDRGAWVSIDRSLKPVPDSAGGFHRLVSEEILERWFRCHFWSPVTAGEGAGSSDAAIAGVLGVLMTGLFAGLVWTQGRSRREQAAVTSELRLAHGRLAEVIRERERLSRDLHDGTIQSVYAVGFELQRVRSLVERNPPAAQAEITRILATLNEVVAELREFILQEETGGKSVQTLDTVLNALVGRLRRTTQAEISLELAPDASRLIPPEQVVELLHIVREALTNSIRHGYPRQIGIALTREGRDWRLTVADDGTGFDPQRASGHPGRGLLNLQERADELGGECVVVSVPGTGAAVRVIFPVLADLSPPEPEAPSA
ncbi:MAG: sensor histidine kinase [Verrucomicrobia bacterium]|nr:sensor histidine kinase [Verrucomicrobiota bacterium]